MAFSIRDLSVLAYSNGFTLWHYKISSGTLPDAAIPGFFDPAADMLSSGDMVLVSSTAGARMLCLADSGTSLVAAPLG